MNLEMVGDGRRAAIYAYAPGQVVKLYHSPAHNEHAANEARATAAVHAAGVPAPACYGTVEIEGRVGILLEHLAGPELITEVLSGAGRAAMRDLAALHATIHGRDGAAFTPFMEVLETRISANLPPAQASEVVRRMKTLDPGSSVLHTDLHVRNVMRNAQGAAIAIDWDEAYCGPPLYGVARSRFLGEEAWAGEVEDIENIQQLRRDLTSEYLLEYAAHRPFDAAELDAWRIPVLAARLDENIAEERGYLVTELERALAD